MKPCRIAARAALTFMLLVTLSSSPANARTVPVAITDFAFSPETVTVRVGDRIDWGYALGDGTAPHTVTADDGSFDSGNITPGGSFTQTFARAGTVAYYCRLHGGPGGVGMAGVIHVKANGSAPAPKPSAAAPDPTGSAAAPPPSASPSATRSTEPEPSTPDEPSATPSGREDDDGPDPADDVVASGPSGGSSGPGPAGAIAAVLVASVGTAVGLVVRARPKRAAGGHGPPGSAPPPV